MQISSTSADDCTAIHAARNAMPPRPWYGVLVVHGPTLIESQRRWLGEPQRPPVRPDTSTSYEERLQGQRDLWLSIGSVAHKRWPISGLMDMVDPVQTTSAHRHEQSASPDPRPHRLDSQYDGKSIS